MSDSSGREDRAGDSECSALERERGGGVLALWELGCHSRSVWGKMLSHSHQDFSRKQVQGDLGIREEGKEEGRWEETAWLQRVHSQSLSKS